MSDYDALAARYDAHFSRPVDHWEDGRLAQILSPHVDGRDVLDLACGTGWVADTCKPRIYTGIDASAAMLAECTRKHPQATVIKAEIGALGWLAGMPAGRRFDTITCTWAAHYLGDLTALLADLEALAHPGAPVILHGCGPRYAARPHYIANGDAHLGFTPAAVTAAAARAHWDPPRALGCGALPDVAAEAIPGPLGRALWTTALQVPARWHYSVAYTLRVPWRND
jgi:SAM-dependent methyltransferase